MISASKATSISILTESVPARQAVPIEQAILIEDLILQD